MTKPLLVNISCMYPELENMFIPVLVDKIKSNETLKSSVFDNIPDTSVLVLPRNYDQFGFLEGICHAFNSADYNDLRSQFHIRARIIQSFLESCKKRPSARKDVVFGKDYAILSEIVIRAIQSESVDMFTDMGTSPPIRYVDYVPFIDIDKTFICGDGTFTEPNWNMYRFALNWDRELGQDSILSKAILNFSDINVSRFNTHLYNAAISQPIKLGIPSIVIKHQDGANIYDQLSTAADKIVNDILQIYQPEKDCHEC